MRTRTLVATGMWARMAAAGIGCMMLGCASVPRVVAGTAARRTVEYHGIRPTDPDGKNGLRNPERGLRIETLFGEPEDSKAWGPVHHLKGKVSPESSDEWWIQDARHYERHGLTLAQTYCYLNRFADKPISRAKLNVLQGSMDRIRENGLKMVLRFAYEKNMKREGGPKLATVLEHIDQLAPVIRKNTDVIFVMQAGFVGAWGEWHNGTHISLGDHKSLAAIVARILEVLPVDRMTQVRVPKYKRNVLTQPILGGFEKVGPRFAHTDRPAARIGFNND